MPPEVEQGLEVRKGVVQPLAAGPAVNAELRTALPQPLPDRQHGVGVVLLDRHADAVGRRLGGVHRVKVPEHNVRSDAKALAEQKPRVRGDLKLALARPLPQAVKGARGVDKAAFHGFPSPGWFMVLIVT